MPRAEPLVGLGARRLLSLAVRLLAAGRRAIPRPLQAVERLPADDARAGAAPTARRMLLKIGYHLRWRLILRHTYILIPLPNERQDHVRGG